VLVLRKQIALLWWQAPKCRCGAVSQFGLSWREHVTVTPNDSDHVNRSDTLQRFLLIHTSTIANTILHIRTTECMRTRQSPNEIVGDCSDEGGHWYQVLNHFILREVLACRRRQARRSTESGVGRERYWRWWWILLPRVMTYVVFCKLIFGLNWCCAICISRGLI